MTKKLWGGRFTKKTNPLVEEFTRSIQYDYKLFEYDIVGSVIHVGILKKAGILSAGEAHKIISGLKAIKFAMQATLNATRKQWIHGRHTGGKGTDGQEDICKFVG